MNCSTPAAPRRLFVLSVTAPSLLLPLSLLARPPRARRRAVAPHRGEVRGCAVTCSPISGHGPDEPVVIGCSSASATPELRLDLPLSHPRHGRANPSTPCVPYNKTNRQRRTGGDASTHGGRRRGGAQLMMVCQNPDRVVPGCGGDGGRPLLPRREDGAAQAIRGVTGRRHAP